MAPLAQVLEPGVAHTPTRPPRSDRGASRYLWSYLLQRFVIGIIGLLVPFVIMLGNYISERQYEGSLSAYYYTGMRDVFVGGLVTIGFFLMTYMVFERNLDNYFSVVAGVSVVVVALAPTGDPASAESESVRAVEMNMKAVAKCSASRRDRRVAGLHRRHEGSRHPR